MSDLKKMKNEIHHEKHAAQRLYKNEERQLRKSVEREAEAFKALYADNR